ncbi:hypothetical protein HMPREF9997_00376 [Corynebacterium durum F0235]|uniref:Uncharacterized protein n=1 Tax=Corynebacterium durum F0235 TaxID=1035195 RepID=L1MMC9_9CORY|nr:hypothetical protein HMPREF9997_00376 [Corynebacterium durum F0235]
MELWCQVTLLPALMISATLTLPNLTRFFPCLSGILQARPDNLKILQTIIPTLHWTGERNDYPRL